MMSDFPNLRTIHAGGVLISDEPITSYVDLDMPPKGFPPTQWDMYVAEDIGFNARPLRGEMEDMPHLAMPAILRNTIRTNSTLCSHRPASCPTGC